MLPRLPSGRTRGVASALVTASVVAAALLSPPSTAVAQAPVPLPVPWIGQAYCQEHCSGPVWWQGRNNCGPASLAMVAQANGIPRPGALTNARYVRHVKALSEGVDNCGTTSRAELDGGARALGLCVREEAWSTAAIEALTRKCLPVVTYLDDRTMPWRHNPSFYRGADHIVVATGFVGDRVTVNDPLENSIGDTGCSPLPHDHENRAYGKAHTSYGRADFDAAAYLADYGWWGKAYGDALGGCDVPSCNRPGVAAPSDGAPGPYTRLTFRLASHCPDNRIRAYYVTDATGADGAFREKWSKGKTIVNDGRFRTYTITFEGETSRQYWRGTLRKLRIDPSGSSGCLVAISWIGIHDANGRSVRSWTFPGGRGGEWWARDTVTTAFMGPFWAMHTTSDDPWIENDRVDVAVGR